MKKKINKLTPLVGSLSIFFFSPLWLSSCGKRADSAVYVKNLIANSFNSQPKIKQANDKDSAINDFINNELNSDHIKNEILFDAFNFLGKQNLTINQNKYCENKSLIDLINQQYAQTNSIYEINYEKTSNGFWFCFQGYYTIQFQKDVENTLVKKGDFLQFVFDVQKRVNVIVDLDTNNRITFTYNLSNEITSCIGFIKSIFNSQYQYDLVINNFDEINYANHIFNSITYQLKTID